MGRFTCFLTTNGASPSNYQQTLIGSAYLHSRHAMDTLLQVSDFSLHIGPVPVVHNVSFNLRAGERVSIVGESGSGKTVTALALMGLQPGRISGGKALFRNAAGKQTDLFSLPGKALHELRGKEIGYVFQEPGVCLNPVLTCGAQLAEVIRFHSGASAGEAKAETLRWLGKVGLPHAFYERYPHQLSGGQKQRVMLAIAMAPKPRLLLADEPTTALDVTVQKQMLGLLDNLCTENGTALLFITHDLGLAAAASARTLVMHRGQLVEEGPSPALLSAPKQPYTQKLVRARITRHTEPAPKITPQAETAVSAQNLRVAYRDSGLFRTQEPVWAVNNVSFTIRRGETLGLVGESGSGKSTIAQVLMGLKAPDSGSVQLFGQNPYTLPKAELRSFRKRFRIVFQDPYASLNPKLGIGGQIAETMAVYNLHGNAKARAEKTTEWLTRVGLLPDDVKRLPHTFSGGQRQRIAIARALACGPEFLVCDECVSSLDVSLQRDILDLLLHLQSQLNMSLLFISHDPAAVHFMCDNVLVLKDGKPMEYGPVREVWTNPQSAYTRQLLQSVL